MNKAHMIFVKVVALLIIGARKAVARAKARLDRLETTLINAVPNGTESVAVVIFNNSVTVIRRKNRKVDTELLTRLYGHDAADACYMVKRSFSPPLFDKMVAARGISESTAARLTEVTVSEHVKVTVNK